MTLNDKGTWTNKKRPVPTVLLSHTEHKKIVLFPCACVYVRFVTCSISVVIVTLVHTHTHAPHEIVQQKSHKNVCYEIQGSFCTCQQ